MIKKALGVSSINFDPAKVIPVIEEGIKVELLNLEANRILSTNDFYTIQQRIQEAQILLSVLRLSTMT